MTEPIVFDRYDDVIAALADASLVPPPAADGPAGGVAWLRARVARFGSGEVHARRRALVEADLASLDPGALRRAAATECASDVRLRVVRALAAQLGLAEPEAVARDVVLVARAYFADAPDDPEADAAVARLLPAMGCGEEGAEQEDPGQEGAGREDTGQERAGRESAGREGAGQERAANRIGLLVQACEATAALVEHARRGTGLEAALRDDPPVRMMRRVAARDTAVAGVALPAGTPVLLDLVAAQEPDREPLTFGASPRICPGRAHALAIAGGILHGASALGEESR
ncbi:hypothetical protein ACIRS1_19690 [Kitasatospora sp. NPDC101176]|uniref:hypothetical protein n=1 Tax=Kitasatospora sp. NPDC101176 TaxID=3364099 RepID=UPI00380FB801